MDNDLQQDPTTPQMDPVAPQPEPMAPPIGEPDVSSPMEPMGEPAGDPEPASEERPRSKALDVADGILMIIFAFALYAEIYSVFLYA